MQGDALGRELGPDPVVEVVAGQLGPVGHGPAEQPGGVDPAGWRLAVGQDGEVGLPGVVDPPEAPHAAHVVLGDVAVPEEVTGRLLDPAGAALHLQVVGLAGAERLGVEPAGGRQLGLGLLVEPGVGVVVGLVGHRVEAPAVAAAVQVVDVQHLGAGVDQAELGRVAEVAPRDRGGRVAEGVGGVAVRLLRGRLVEPVHERLGAVVDGPRARPVGVGVRVDGRQLVPVGGADVLVLGADLVEQQGRLAEGLLGGWGDGRLPARGQRAGPAGAGVVGVEVDRAGRLHHQGPEQPVADRRPVPRARVEVVGALEHGVVGHEVAVGAAVAAGRRRGAVAANRHAGAGGVVGQPVDVDAEAAARGVVQVRDLDTVALVGPDHQRLDGVAPEPGRHLLAALLGPQVVEPAGEDVHLAGRVVVAEPVEGDVDVDGGDVELLEWRSVGTGRSTGGRGRLGRDLAGPGEGGHQRGRDQRGRGQAGQPPRPAGSGPAGGPCRGGMDDGQGGGGQEQAGG